MRRALVAVLLLSLFGAVVAAQESVPPAEITSVTDHAIVVNGVRIDYTATAGTLLLRNGDGKPTASLFYVAYQRKGVDPASRPVTFSYNGGPGSAAVWVHMGAFGPKKVAADAEGLPLPPPGKLVDNPHTLLDVTDLVFIDPAGTGYSRILADGKREDFHGVRQDGASVGEFIRLWITRNERWASPKYLAGESYGTTRNAVVANYVQSRFGMHLNGIVMVSTVLNFQNQDFNVGNDIPFIIHLPTYAATAWYHGKLAGEPRSSLREYLDEVEEYARGEYAWALLQGDRLSAEKRDEVAARVAAYTGLSRQFVLQNDLRIVLGRFQKELRRDEGVMVGRLDSRFTGQNRDLGAERPEFDPAMAGLDVGYVAMIQDYLRRELGWESDQPFQAISNVRPWDYGVANQYVNVAEDLRMAIERNPELHVLFTAGYYDFATPYFDTVFTVDHIGLPESMRDNLRIEYYEAGHMMYVREVDHAKMKRDIVALIEDTAGPLD